MFRNIFVTKSLFFDFFEKHIELSLQAAKELHDSLSNNQEKLASNTIKQLEHQGDDITHQCAEALHKTFITPLDRDQIYALISRLDDILDGIDAVADAFQVFKITTPTPSSIALANLLVHAIEHLQVAVKGLRHMQETSVIKAACKAINQLEHDADAIFRKALGELFDTETDARQIIKWKDIYENLEEASDKCADASDVIQGILLENN